MSCCQPERRHSLQPSGPSYPNLSAGRRLAPYFSNTNRLTVYSFNNSALNSAISSSLKVSRKGWIISSYTAFWPVRPYSRAAFRKISLEVENHHGAGRLFVGRREFYDGGSNPKFTV
jgi:hypothetical protein